MARVAATARERESAIERAPDSKEIRCLRAKRQKVQAMLTKLRLGLHSKKRRKKTIEIDACAAAPPPCLLSSPLQC